MPDLNELLGPDMQAAAKEVHRNLANAARAASTDEVVRAAFMVAVLETVLAATLATLAQAEESPVKAIALAQEHLARATVDFHQARRAKRAADRGEQPDGV